MGKGTKRNGKHHRRPQIGQEEQSHITESGELRKVEKMGHDAQNEGTHSYIYSEISGASSQKTRECAPRGIATTRMFGMKPSAFHRCCFTIFKSLLRSECLRFHLFAMLSVRSFEKIFSIKGEIIGGGEFMCAFHTLTTRSGFHPHAKNEGLLQHQYQHSWEQEGGKSALGIVQRHVFIGQRRSGDLLLSLSGTRSAQHFDARIGLQCHICGGGEHGFVVEHTAHIAIYLHSHGSSALQIAIHLRGEGNNAIGFALAHQLLGFGERICTRHHSHIGRSV